MEDGHEDPTMIMLVKLQEGVGDVEEEKHLWDRNT